MEDENKKEASTNDHLLMDIFEVFMETFDPGNNKDNDEQMTTTEICDHIEDISGFEPSKKEIVQLLKDHDYSFAWTDSGFKWMLKFRR